MENLTSIFKLKCPRCRKGNLFCKPFRISDPLCMPKRCEVCGQRTEPEPGFYFGAMFLSYMISGIILLGLALILIFYFRLGVVLTMTIIIMVSALFYIRLMRFSRALWIHMMVSYDPDCEKVTEYNKKKYQ